MILAKGKYSADWAEELQLVSLSESDRLQQEYIDHLIDERNEVHATKSIERFNR